ncbi:MAG: creatininase family protein [Spirochaetota bacterium]
MKRLIHGGNTAVLRVALRAIREETGLIAYLFEVYDSETIRRYALELDFHAGEVETALMLSLYPDQVREQSYPAPWKGSPLDIANVRLNVPWQAEDFASSGVIGNPNGATARLGKEVLSALAEELAGLLLTVLNREDDEP